MPLTGLGRQESNHCIRNRARLGLPLSCGAKSGSRSCAGLQQACARSALSARHNSSEASGTQIPDAEVRILPPQPRSRVSRSEDVSREKPSARTQLTDAVMKAGGTIPQAPNCLGTGRKKRLLPHSNKFEFREKLAPSAAGPFPCSGRAWNFCLVEREGRRYRLMQREGKPSPRVPKCWSRPSFGGAFSLVPSRRRPLVIVMNFQGG
jgi:hypothetical protein